jgi:hypothetical protein
VATATRAMEDKAQNTASNLPLVQARGLTQFLPLPCILAVNDTAEGHLVEPQIRKKHAAPDGDLHGRSIHQQGHRL